MSLLLSHPSIQTVSTPLTSSMREPNKRTAEQKQTCCAKLTKFRRRKPWINLILYAMLTYITAFIGGLIFSALEYQNEVKQIKHKQELYANIKSLLPNTSHQQLDELLNMSAIPLSQEDNRWTLGSSIFFAFTTMSTIG